MLPKPSEDHLGAILNHVSPEEIPLESRNAILTGALKEILVEPSSSRVTLVMELPALLSESMINSLENAAVKVIPGMSIKVEQLLVKPPNGTATTCGAATLAEWPAILSALRAASPRLAPWLRQTRPEIAGETLKVPCTSSMVIERLKSLNAAGLISAEVARRHGWTPQVEFVIGDGPAPASTPERPRLVRRPAAPAGSSSVLMGGRTQLKGETTAIRDLVASPRQVIVEGEIFSIEIKSVWQKRARTDLLLAGLTDDTDSIRIKLMDPPSRMKELKPGDRVRILGTVATDKFENDEIVLTPREALRVPALGRKDEAPVKRVELNLHTKASRLSGLIGLDELIAQVKAWGWEGLAITDTAVVQSFPRAWQLAKKAGLKLGLGCHLHYVNDLKPIAWNFAPDRPAETVSLRRPHVVFDLETTGLSALTNKVIEVAAYRVEENRIVDEFTSFVNPHEPLSDTVKRITGIDDALVEGAPDWAEVFGKLQDFTGDATLVAHNIAFDAGFLRTDWARSGRPMPPLLDTLGLARAMLPELNTFTLASVAKALGVPLINAHRAADDARALARVFIEMLLKLRERGVTNLAEVNAMRGAIKAKRIPAQAVTALVQNTTGLRNLNLVVSASHLEHLHIFPRVPASLLESLREGLLLGSGAVDGPVVQAILGGEDPALVDELMRRFDYLEVGPPEIYGELLAEGQLRDAAAVESLIATLVDVADRNGKPCVAVSLAHHLERRQLIYRKVLRFASDGDRVDRMPSLHLRTTEEMLSELAFLGAERARRVAVETPRRLFALLEDVPPIPKGFFPPTIPGAEEEIRSRALARAQELYGREGGALPPGIAEVIDKELKAIIGNGFAVLYYIAMKLVEQSNAAGYVVGSRGSVGSSLVAFLTGITEVNPLPPHYRCPRCRRVAWADDETDGNRRPAGCGPDLPPRECCGGPMMQDGYRIPFEAFMGLEGNKTPDIDLNFAGEYQATAMAEIERIFGKDHVFRAGTISTLQERNARGFPLKYVESRSLSVRRAEIDRLARGITEVSRTTGQHPGGIVIVPHDHAITDFMPVQHPADAAGTDTITTHYDFHSYEGTLVKVDVLGHDAPSVIRLLKDLTGIDPMTLPLADPRVLSLFSSPRELGLSADKLGCPVGTLGIPEYGTPFVVKMLAETKPKCVEELIRISGLSHGTDVWIGNAQELFQAGTAKLADVIATREDIWNRLVQHGVEPAQAYAIMEKVRKGKGLAPEDEALMRKHKVADWILGACQKIKYLFPRAHAVAYDLMSLRIAWFKVYRPPAFYAAYLTSSVADLELETAVAGASRVSQRVSELRAKEASGEATDKESDSLVVLEVVREMHLRGITLLGVDIRKSDPTRFLLEGDAIRPPLVAVAGLGEKLARRIVDELASGDRLSVEDLAVRAGIPRPIAERLASCGAFGEMPKTNQLELF